MAVQAQYPTNVLLHDRSLQEDTKEYSLRPQMGEDGSRFLDDQSPNNVFFNSFAVGSCGINPGKAGREVDLNRFVRTVHRQQSSCNQLIDLTHLHSRNAGVNTGLQLAFSDHQLEQQPKHSVSPRSSVGWCLMSKELSAQINQERDEIEHFLQVQGEELRRTLAEKRERHYSMLLEAAEVFVSQRLKDKDVEAEKAVSRKAELEARASHLSMEAEVWQTRAMAQEAESAALQAQLQQVIVTSGRGRCFISQGEEGGLRCATGNYPEDAESAYIDPERVVVASGPGCKSCGKRVASVVLLPCRHLCVCTECDGVVLACPLCLSLRSSSIQVYMS